LLIKDICSSNSSFGTIDPGLIHYVHRTWSDLSLLGLIPWAGLRPPQ